MSVAAALNAALELASQGLRCFPCAPSKVPTTPRGFLDASAKTVVLRKLWANLPGPLVGVPTGAASGIGVLDLDRKHPEAAQWWKTRRQRLPPTRVHRTRSGGLHLIFRHAPGMRCSTSKITPGLDIRADGGYVIWWPAAGLPVLCDAPLAPFPEWLRAQLVLPPQPLIQRITIPDTRSPKRHQATVKSIGPIGLIGQILLRPWTLWVLWVLCRMLSTARYRPAVRRRYERGPRAP
jgi:hypothetical protein